MRCKKFFFCYLPKPVVGHRTPSPREGCFNELPLLKSLKTNSPRVRLPLKTSAAWARPEYARGGPRDWAPLRLAGLRNASSVEHTTLDLKLHAFLSDNHPVSSFLWWFLILLFSFKKIIIFFFSETVRPSDRRGDRTSSDVSGLEGPGRRELMMA